MADQPSTESRACAERDAVALLRGGIRALDRRMRATPAFLHIVVLLLTLCLTLGATWMSHRLVEERQTARFERETDRLERALRQRLYHYEDAMQAGIAALDASGGRMNREAWRRFADGLHPGNRYPGVHGIGFIESVETSNLEDSMTSAAVAAISTGTPRITAPIDAVQDGLERRSFVLYSPYRGPPGPNTDANAMTGVVYAQFAMTNLVAGALDPSLRSIDIAIRDGDTLLLDEAQAGDARLAEAEGGRATLHASKQLEVYGRVWTIAFDARSTFTARGAHAQTGLVLFGGLIIDLMLFGLFVSFARTNKALALSARMSRALDERSRALEETNRELERFACVASHDLKTPLRGIADIAWYLREDLAPYLKNDDPQGTVAEHLARLERQTERMEALIEGILDYSGIGRQDAHVGEVDTAIVLNDIADALDLPLGALVPTGPLPVLRTERVPLAQVLTNLIDNAVKYHPDAARARVHVAFDVEQDRCTISVRDNGPGIDPRFQERIFEMFETLQPKDTIESTGIGLAIVKKLVERRGGTVSLDSTPGKGSTFTVLWPLSPGLAAPPMIEVSEPVDATPAGVPYPRAA